MYTQLSDENKKITNPTNMNNQNWSLNNNMKNESIINTSKISNDNLQEIDNNIESLMQPSGSKEKKVYHVQNRNHPKCSTCMYNYQKNLEKNTSALSNYILNNEVSKQKYYCYPNIKLLGNSRYKYTNPLLFVEDQKNNISSRTLGLLPIPLEKFHKKAKNEKEEKEGKNLYELQRSIVMFRRRQYNDHYEKKPNRNKNRDNIFTDLYDLDISNKKESNKSYINKIILIQKWWRNLLLKRYLEEYNNNINDFEMKLKVILMKMALKKLMNVLLVKQILKKYCYLEKKRIKYSYNDFIEAIKKIQNNFRKYKAKKLRNNLEKNLKKNNKIQNNDNIIQNANNENENDNNSNLNKNGNDENDMDNEEYFEDNNINNDDYDDYNNNINNNDNDDYNENNEDDNKNDVDDNKNNKEDNINDDDDNLINNKNNDLDDSYNIKPNDIQINDEEEDNLDNDKKGNYNSYEVDDNKNDIDNEINNNKNDNININSNPNANTNKDIITETDNLKNKDKDKDKDKDINNINSSNENDFNNKNKKGDDASPSKRNSRMNKTNIFENIRDDDKNKNNLKENDKIENNNLDNKESKEPTKKRDSIKENLKKIIPFNNILNKLFHSYTFKKIRAYINEPTANIPLINMCYLTKDNAIILYAKKHEKKIIHTENVIEKSELQINVKNNYIEKIYKKPIINGNGFKYQYCFSNNPHSYMNVCYITKIRMNEYLRYLIKLQRKIKSFLLSKKYENFSKDEDLDDSFNAQITHRNNLSEKATKRKYSKDNENNDFMNSFKKDNQDIEFSFDKSNPNNSKLSFSNISDKQKKELNFNDNNDIEEKNENINIDDFIQNKNSIMRINKNFQKGFFISKVIFKQKKVEITKIQEDLKEREVSNDKNRIFKRPSIGNVEKSNKNNNNNNSHNSDNFDTGSIKATIVFNNDRKISFKDGDIYYLNSSKDKANSPKNSKKNINNKNPSYESRESNNENDINVEIENLSDSNIFTKIKINCSSDEEIQDNDNAKDANNSEYKDNEDNSMKKTSGEFFYITKERRKDFMKYICKIKNFYKIYFKSKKSNKNHIYINKFRKPIIKSCIISIKRMVKEEKDKLYIYNPKIKYFLYLINLFVKKNMQEFIFEKIKFNNNEKNIKNYHDMPFYIRTIQRVMKYLQKKNNCNKKVFLFFNEIFNVKNKKMSLLNKLCTLPKKERTKLIFSNLFTGYEENELINFICDFSQYDKNLNNENFITKRLMQSKLNDTNIFTLIRIIDKEYENLVEGVYCLKCFNNVNLCICRSETQRYFDNYENKNSNRSNNNNNINTNDMNKNNNDKENNDNNINIKNSYDNENYKNNINDDNTNNNISNKEEEKHEDDKNIEEDEDDDFQTLDIDLNDDEDEYLNTKRKINYFDYNTNENIGGNILIKTKSKVNKNDNKKLLDIVI